MNKQATFGKRINPVAYVAALPIETKEQEAARIAADWTGERPSSLPKLSTKR